MGYTTTGGVKGLGQFNNTPQTTADLNKLLELIGKMGNYRGAMTEGERDLILGADRFDGLMVFNQSSGRINVWSDDLFDWWDPTSEDTYYPDSFGAGWSAASGYPVVIRVFGDRVHIEGAVVVASGASFDNILTVPIAARPGAIRWVGATVGQGAAITGMLDVTTAGRLRLPYRTGSLAAGQLLPLSGSWTLS